MAYRVEFKWPVRELKVEAFERGLHRLAGPTPALVHLHHCKACRSGCCHGAMAVSGVPGKLLRSCSRCNCATARAGEAALGVEAGDYAKRLCMRLTFNDHIMRVCTSCC